MILSFSEVLGQHFAMLCSSFINTCVIIFYLWEKTSVKKEDRDLVMSGNVW